MQATRPNKSNEQIKSNWMLKSNPKTTLSKFRETLLKVQELCEICHVTQIHT